MKRVPRQAQITGYPISPLLVDRRRFMAALGAGCGVAASFTLGGCMMTAGEPMMTGPTLWPVRLPAEGLRALRFEGQGALDYCVEASTESYQLYASLVSDDPGRLPAMDAVMLTHALADFSSELVVAQVEGELRRALLDRFHADAGASSDDFVSLRLFISGAARPT
ncbi:MAG: hypothetical protein HY904_23690 [Deltaproteobacteria bacterium]|nr:hypothetical protein [Deltaproteobacteria bacterium]